MNLDIRLVELVTTDRTAQELFSLASLKCGWSTEQFLTELALAMANDKRLVTDQAVAILRVHNGLPPFVEKQKGMDLMDFAI